MKLTLQSLRLFTFRNYRQVEFHFAPHLNLISGGNAQGKTNLLEAIYLASTGRSFRTRDLSALIRTEAPHFSLEAHFVKREISHRLLLSFDGKERRLQCDATSSASFTDLLGLMPSVVYAPQDVALIGGAPAERRRFLDLHIAQSDRLYVPLLVRYLRAMRQRNTLLRSGQLDSLTLWEQMMAEAACQLITIRKRALEELKERSARHLAHLSKEADTLELSYSSSMPIAASCELLADQWRRERERDLQRLATGSGPHRDDFEILLGGKPAKTFASEGQKRSCITALHFAEWERLAARTQTTPLFLIDDVGMHLDKERLEALYGHLQNLGQIFLTAPHFDRALEGGKMFVIADGKLAENQVGVEEAFFPG